MVKTAAEPKVARMVSMLKCPRKHILMNIRATHITPEKNVARKLRCGPVEGKHAVNLRYVDAERLYPAAIRFRSGLQGEGEDVNGHERLGVSVVFIIIQHLTGSITLSFDLCSSTGVSQSANILIQLPCRGRGWPSTGR